MKEKIFSIFFIAFLILMMLMCIISTDVFISKDERRKLQQFPRLTISNIMSGSYMEDLDLYFLDQFVFRDKFRQIKANVSYNILKKKDNNKIFMIDSHIFKSEYPIDKKSINNFINKLNRVGEYFTDNNRVFYSIIPDKNFYIESNDYLNIDYEYLYDEISKINYTYIDLRDELSLGDYYRTDTHWKQENLKRVVEKLGLYLGFNDDATYDIKEYKNFYGVYYGQAALNLIPDTITYMVNEDILNSEVLYLENPYHNTVYIEENLKSLDSYNIYLDGPSSYIQITNPLNNSGKELVIFRDSFASSLTPLLIDKYSKITMIDMRYIGSDTYLKYISFNNQDVLFLFSTLIVNNSYTLKN